MMARTCLAVLLVALTARADELELLDGTRVSGKLIYADEATVTFNTDGAPVSRRRSDVRAIHLKDGPGGPPGASLGEGLRVLRWFTVRRLMPFPPDEMDSMYTHSISADGSKILFSCGRGVFTINPDGTGLAKILDKKVETHVVLSSDGQKAVWYEDRRRGFVARSDGSGAARFGAEHYVLWYRLTAAADRVIYATSDEGGGIFVVGLDGSPPRKIAGTAAVAALTGARVNADDWWRNGGSISHDGSRIVFLYGENAFSVGGDGNGLRALTRVDPKQDKAAVVRLSRDGQRLAIYFDNGDLGTKSRLEIREWDGEGRVSFTGNKLPRGQLFSGISLGLSQDGRQAALGPELSLYQVDERTSWKVADEGLRGEDLAPLYGVHFVSFTPDFRRAVADLSIGRAQLAVIDFNPPTLLGAPSLGRMEVSPRSLPSNGSEKAAATARPPEEGWRYVGVSPYREGFHIDAWFYNHSRLKDPDKTGTFRADLEMYRDYKVPPGPLQLRFFTFNKAAHTLVVDVEGVEVR